MENIEQLIIEKAKQLIKEDFMQYPFYDEDELFTINDAITFFVARELDEVESSEVFDFITSKLK